MSVTASGDRQWFRFGGGALALAGALFFAHHLTGMAAGEPPTDGQVILDWAESEKAWLRLGNEFLFFAIGLLVPGIVALYRALEPRSPIATAVGAGLFAVTVPIVAVLDVVHGRFYYPVYRIEVDTPEMAEFTVALYYGGLHAVLLIWAGGTAALSVAMLRAQRWRRVAYAGFAVAAVDVVASYPWLLPPIVQLATQLAFAGWFVFAGLTLLRVGRPFGGTG